MTAAELLAECQARRIALQAHGGQLDIDAPAGELTDELLQALRTKKAELLKLLAGGPQDGDGGPVAKPSELPGDDRHGADGPQDGGPSDIDAAGLEIIDVPMPCPTCQGIVFWWDVAGGAHCERCSPRTRATRLREHARRLRELHARHPRRPAAGCGDTG